MENNNKFDYEYYAVSGETVVYYTNELGERKLITAIGKQGDLILNNRTLTEKLLESELNSDSVYKGE